MAASTISLIIGVNIRFIPFKIPELFKVFFIQFLTAIIASPNAAVTSKIFIPNVSKIKRMAFIASETPPPTTILIKSNTANNPLNVRVILSDTSSVICNSEVNFLNPAIRLKTGFALSKLPKMLFHDLAIDLPRLFIILTIFDRLSNNKLDIDRRLWSLTTSSTEYPALLAYILNCDIASDKPETDVFVAA